MPIPWREFWLSKRYSSGIQRQCSSSSNIPQVCHHYAIAQWERGAGFEWGGVGVREGWPPTTVKPLLSGNPRDWVNWPLNRGSLVSQLNRGWPLNRGSTVPGYWDAVPLVPLVAVAGSHLGFDFPGCWLHVDMASPVHAVSTLLDNLETRRKCTKLLSFCSFYPSIHLYFQLLSIHPYVCPSINPSIHRYVPVFPSIQSPVCLYAILSILQSFVRPSFCLWSFCPSILSILHSFVHPASSACLPFAILSSVHPSVPPPIISLPVHQSVYRFIYLSIYLCVVCLLQGERATGYGVALLLTLFGKVTDSALLQSIAPVVPPMRPERDDI